MEVLGFANHHLCVMALQMANGYMSKNAKMSPSEIRAFFAALVASPSEFMYKPYHKLAERVMSLQKNEEQPQEMAVRQQVIPFEIFGKEYIDEAAINQMYQCMRLPVAVAGALMPDAHVGYGLPIGGVMATQSNIVIPYAVGVDIACRMSLSVYPLAADTIRTQHDFLADILDKNTRFGSNSGFERPMDDPFFDTDDWNETKLLRHLKDRAWRQVGSSGTGNHFVEWGILSFNESTLIRGQVIQSGSYLALLSHSGSRGFGANIAQHYTKVAAATCKLPKGYQHLAWLDLSEAAGAEYWHAMNMAGEYAALNHRQIHRRLSHALKERPLLQIENHHNFAWREKLPDGTDVIVHRKGATPAGADELGIIPGSMTDTGYLVRGKGLAPSLNSASHGAGRAYSRSKARLTFTRSEMKKQLAAKGVTLIGGDVDESPMAYKNIGDVLAAQANLVDVLASFTPKIVRMADGGEAED